MTNVTTSTRTWETNAAEFAQLDSGKGWPFAALVACSVQVAAGKGRPSKSAIADLQGKVSPNQFADAAGTSADRIVRYLAAWNAAAEAGQCTASEHLKPGDFDITAQPSADFGLFYDATASGRKSAAQVAKEAEERAAAEAELRIERERQRAEAEANRAIRDAQVKAENEAKRREAQIKAETEARVRNEERAKANAEREAFIAEQKKSNETVIREEAAKLAAKVEADRARARAEAEKHAAEVVAKAQQAAAKVKVDNETAILEAEVDRLLMARDQADRALLAKLEEGYRGKDKTRLLTLKSKFSMLDANQRKVNSWIDAAVGEADV